MTLRRGEPVGTVMLKMAPLTSEQRPMPLSDDHEVGWHLHPDHWGQGYATEATGGALKRAFDAGVDKVVALILPGNERSVMWPSASACSTADSPIATTGSRRISTRGSA